MFFHKLEEAGYESALLVEINRQLIYNSTTGIFTNRIYRNRLARKGDTAGYARKDGYIGINLGGKSYLAHRLAWLISHNYLPKFIDHINTDRTDNRIINLREATRENNNANTNLRVDNKLGIKGISLHPNGYYYCCVVVNKVRNIKYVKISNYETQELALEAAITWITYIREQLHKEFTNHGV